MRFDRLELQRWPTETMVTQTQQNDRGPKKCSECRQTLPNIVGVVWTQDYIDCYHINPQVLDLKPRQKGRGRCFISFAKTRLKTEGQNDCHSPGHVYIYPATSTPTRFLLISCTRSIESVLVQYL